MAGELAVLEVRLGDRLAGQLRDHRDQTFAVLGAMTTILSVALVVVGMG